LAVSRSNNLGSPNSDESVQHALNHLADLLGRLRLMNLRCVKVSGSDRRNGNFGYPVLESDDLDLKGIAPEDIAGGRLTDQQRTALALYEARGVKRFGAGSGIITYVEEVELDGEGDVPVTLQREVAPLPPLCQVSEAGYKHLQSMSATVVDACSQLSALDCGYHYGALVDKVLTVAYGTGTGSNPPRSPSWGDLAELRQITDYVRAAGAAAAQAATGIQTSEQASAGTRGDGNEGLLTALQRHRELFLQSTIAIQGFYDRIDRCNGTAELLYLGGDLPAHVEGLISRFGYPDGKVMYKWVGEWDKRPVSVIGQIDYESDGWQETRPFWSVSLRAARALEASAQNIEPLLAKTKTALGPAFEPMVDSRGGQSDGVAIGRCPGASDCRRPRRGRW
jgi:hypothetical protein